MSCHSNPGRSLLSTIVTAVVLFAVIGCNKESRTSISGKVTLDGQRVPIGQIVFEPTSTGRLGIAQIADGAYAMPATQGPTPGKYVVRITATRPSGRKAQAGGGRDGAKMVDQIEQFIPAKYNDQSELTTEVVEGTIERDFPLSLK